MPERVQVRPVRFRLVDRDQVKDTVRIRDVAKAIRECPARFGEV